MSSFSKNFLYLRLICLTGCIILIMINLGENFMKNVEMSVDGTMLTIKVDLSQEFGPSSSGKTIIIASTEGNIAVEGHEEAKIGLNIYKKPQK